MADLSSKQGIAWRLLTDKTHTEILYGGAAGGGKSWLGALWLLTMALKYQGSRWLMGRAVLKTLKDTTLNSFFDVCSAHGLKSGEHYTYNAQTSIITIGRSQILLKDLFAYPSDPNFDDLGSLEITGAFIDEANQVTERAKAIVGSRIRYKLGEFGLIPKMLLTCNPAKNWVHREFYAPYRDGTLEPHRAFVPALVTDNPNISPEYVKALGRMSGPDRARLLLGDWDYDDDPARLMSHDAIADLWTNDHVPSGKKCLIVDVAGEGRDKSVIAYWEGLRWVHTTVLDTNTGPQLVAAISQIMKQEGVPRSGLCIDADGAGGLGAADYFPGCYRYHGGARPFEMSGKPNNFMNLNVQCVYALRDHVNDAMICVEDEKYRTFIEEDLAWFKSYRTDHDGKLRILPKDKVKEGLGRSPDFGDTMKMRMVFELKGTGNASRSMTRQGMKIAGEERREAFRRTWVKGYNHEA